MGQQLCQWRTVGIPNKSLRGIFSTNRLHRCRNLFLIEKNTKDIVALLVRIVLDVNETRFKLHNDRKMLLLFQEKAARKSEP